MPLDPNIILSGRSADVGQAIDSGILNAGRMSAMQTEQLQRDLMAERLMQLQQQGPVSQSILESQATSSQAQATQEQQAAIKEEVLNTALDVKPLLESGDPSDITTAIARVNALKESLARSNLPTESVDQFVSMVEGGDIGGALQMANTIIERNPVSGAYRPYIVPKEVVLTDDDGVDRTYTVPYDTRQGRFLFDQKQLSPKTPTQEGAVAGAKKSAQTKAESETTAQIDLPSVRSNAAYLKDLVKRTVQHPGFEGAVGAPSWGKISSYIPGTKEADFMALHKQIIGKNFLKAYETLKGGGQITEIEGQKATEALSRLSTATSEEEYKAAANEFLSEIDRLTGIAEARAGQTKKRYKYNPKTGKIE